MKQFQHFAWQLLLIMISCALISIGCEDLSGLVDPGDVSDAGNDEVPDTSDPSDDQTSPNNPANSETKPDKPTPDEKPFDGDPGENGPYGIKKISRNIEGQPATIYLPTMDKSSGTPAEGPFPLVIILPGYQAKHSQYSHFTKHIVSHGFFGVGVELPGDNHENCANHVSQVIDWLLSDENPNRCLVDDTEIITAGHSMGGKIAIYAAALDNRITNVLAWDPVDTGGPPCDIDKVACKRWSVTPELMPDIEANLLIFGGKVGKSLSCTPEGETHHDYFAEAPGTALHVDLPNSDHLDWPDDAGEGIMGTIGGLICGGSGKTLGKTVHRISETIQVAWLLKYVKHYTNLDTYFTDVKWSAEIAAGIMTLQYIP